MMENELYVRVKFDPERLKHLGDAMERVTRATLELERATEQLAMVCRRMGDGLVAETTND